MGGRLRWLEAGQGSCGLITDRGGMTDGTPALVSDGWPGGRRVGRLGEVDSLSQFGRQGLEALQFPNRRSLLFPNTFPSVSSLSAPLLAPPTPPLERPLIPEAWPAEGWGAEAPGSTDVSDLVT